MSGIYISGMEMPQEPIMIILLPDGTVATKDYDIGANAHAYPVFDNDQCYGSGKMLSLISPEGSDDANLQEEFFRETGNSERRIFESAISKYGIKSQLLMVVEEMSELTKAICKFFRNPRNEEPSAEIIDAIAEEAADVEITLAQLKMIFGIGDKVREHRCYKIQRLAHRLEVNHEKSRIHDLLSENRGAVSESVG